MFNNINFKIESSLVDKIHQDSFIRCNAPANVTIMNSNISLHYNSNENFEALYFVDKTIWSLDDNVPQFITFQNNIFSFDVAESGVHNNVQINLSGVNKRNQTINIINNSFKNMWHSDRTYIHSDFIGTGITNINGNYFYNWSASDYLIQSHSLSEMTIENMKFDSNFNIFIIPSNRMNSNWIRTFQNRRFSQN